MIHVAVCLGALLASTLSLDFALGNEHLWGILLAAPAAFAFIQLFASWFIPDTPNHLLLLDKEDDAIGSLR